MFYFRMAYQTAFNSSTAQSCRHLSTSRTLWTRPWRLQHGLSQMKTAEGPLTDLPDYTFLDGRPTPLLAKQRLRMKKQQENASTIVRLSSELDFAIKREQLMKDEEESKRREYVENKLKPKGNKLKQ